MMITLSEPIMVSINASFAQHHAINGGFLQFISVRTKLKRLFTACAGFLDDFAQFNPSPLSKRINPELNGALTVKQPLLKVSIINQCFKVL